VGQPIIPKIVRQSKSRKVTLSSLSSVNRNIRNFDYQTRLGNQRTLGLKRREFKDSRMSAVDSEVPLEMAESVDMRSVHQSILKRKNMEIEDPYSKENMSEVEFA